MQKKAPEGAFDFAAYPATSERVLHSDTDRGYVRAESKTTVGAPDAGGWGSAGSNAVRRRAGDVIVGRADPVIDLVVGEVHLGALGHDVVVAQGDHFRLSGVAAGRAADRQVPGSVVGVESGRYGAILTARRLAPARPHLARARVDPAVDDIGGHVHPVA